MNPSILIVEDEAIVALDLKLHLQDLGYTVVALASSADEAVAAVRQHRPSLVLMDVRLHGKGDGIEAAERINRELPTPVIFLTSHSDAQTVQRAASTAPYGYLTKPFQPKEVRAGIEVALAKARLERELREADRWFASTLQCVADGVVVTDLQGHVRFLNPAAESLTGWPNEDAAGRSVGDVVRLQAAGTQAAEDASALVRDVISAGRRRPIVHGLRLQRREGTDTVVDHAAGPVRTEDGLPLGAVLVLRDASERLAHDQERLRLEAIEMANAHKSQFLSRVSHEMRTPLNAVIGFAQLLQTGGETIEPEKLRRYVSHIRNAGEHLLGLVSDLLELNRAAQSSLHLDLQPTSVARAVAETHTLLEGLAQSHGVSLAVTVPDEMHVLADMQRLRQVLLNLGSNAIKYNRQGGEVQVAAQADVAGKVSITVKDTGIGMTPEQLERLFQPFDRLGAERTRVQGTGLGLVICQALVNEMGGSLVVSSEARAGTTATITLPAAA